MNVEVSLLKALVRVVASRELTTSDRQRRMINNGKGIGIYTISPMDFLRLTTTNQTEVATIFESAKPLEFYNSPEIQKDQHVHPFLEFETESGKITGHEGRHRAAAVLKSGGRKFKVGLFPYPKHRDHTLEELPTTLTGQFSTYQIDIDYDEMDEWMMGNFKGHVVV